MKALSGDTMRGVRIGLILLVVQALFVWGCAKQPAATSADRYFSTHWQSWLGYDRQDHILVQIALIHTPISESDDHIATAALANSGGTRVPAADWSINPGLDGDGYRLTALSVTLNPLPPGTHEFDRLELTFADDSTGSWDIGRWVIDVRPTPDEGAQYVRLGRHSGLYGELDWNRFELTNVSDGDILIKDLLFTIPGVHTDGQILTSDEFLPGQDSVDPVTLLLPPGRTRTFQFSFRSDPSVSARFFTIKPRLAIEVDGTEIQATLPAVIYAPHNLTDDQIGELIAVGGRLR